MRADVTGALLYRDGRFVQVLEGPEHAVRALYSTIEADSRHSGIHILVSTQLAARNFQSWSMGYDRPHNAEELPTAGFDNHPEETLSSLPQTFDTRRALFLLASLDAPSITPRCASAPTLAVKFRTIPDSQSEAVTKIYDKILSDVSHGVLVSGERISDAEIAKNMGVSRTPVREALQKLRTAGIVEASANRFTRIAIIDANRTAELMTVFGSLYSAILDEVIGHVNQHVIEQMRLTLIAYDEAVVVGDEVQMTRLGADFYLLLAAASTNDAVKQSLFQAASAVKLGSAHFEELIGYRFVSDCFNAMLTATIEGDLILAKRALAMFMEPFVASLRKGSAGKVGNAG